MNWIVLFIAGVFEVAMTFCLGKTKGAQGTELYLWIGGFVLATVLSMGLLAKAVQTLPIGTAYAIWTGVGALGTVLLGIFVFGESGGFRPDFFYRYLVRFYRRTKIGFALNILNKDGRNIRDVDCRFSDFLNSTVVGAVSEYICRFGRCIRAKIDGMTTVRSIGV